MCATNNSTSIDPRAAVHDGAQIGDEVTIAPFAVIGEHVRVGAGCVIGPHVVLDGWTELGEGCQLSAGVSIGSPPQDVKYGGEATRVVIGRRNVFREYVTVNRGTVGGGGVTSIGDDCFLMAYAHVAHDCHLGDHVIMANCATLSGHITIGDYAFIAGLAAVHQFVRIGAHCMIGGCSGVAQDVPPYALVNGDRAKVYGLNKVGLQRRNFSPESMTMLGKAFRIMFRSKLSLTHALEKVRADLSGCAEVDALIDFIEHSERGICGGA
jgi:UDP-N-acetylglucosamine acyltransferase